jgi:transcriptional antiterminator RfaH
MTRADMTPETLGNPDSSPSWFAVQVKTTHEKRVAVQFDQKGLEPFLPVFRQRRRWSDRVKEVDQPLFPGYVFCRFAPARRIAVLKTDGVARVVSIGSVPAPIDENEILAIQQAVQSGMCVQPHSYLQRGRRVRIEAGPLEGVEGLIVDIRKRQRLILSVSVLRSSMSVDIDCAWVAPISS